MIKRDVASKLLGLANRFPIITIIGPRQSGKTTLAQSVFPLMPYANLENPQTLQFAEDDPIGFIEQFPDGCIIDEVQRAPKILSVLQVVTDKKKVNGQFIITGSQQFTLMESITQSLAGRTFIVKLLPLSIQELNAADKLSPLNQTLFQGFYPNIYSQYSIPSELMQAYFDTYIQKDVRQVINIKNTSLFQKFVGLCAGRIGQLLNKESLSNDLGINVKTVEEWISVLETSFVLTRLQPFWRNTRKRLVKSPKIYFYDVGLASWLLRINSPETMATHPLRGHLFENMIIMEAFKARYNALKDNNLFFYRDGKKKEVDLIFDEGQSIFPIEIKSAATYSSDFAKNFQAIEDLNPREKAVILGSNDNQIRSELDIISWKNFPEYMRKKNIL